MESDLSGYYQDLDELVVRLNNAGLTNSATQLSDAKAGGSTSGEILSHTGAVLRDLRSNVDERDLQLEIGRLLAVVAALWNS